MSQEARNQGPWRWLSSPRLWLRWWSEAVASGRDALRSVWDWLFEDQDSPAAKKYKPKQAHLQVEQYEPRETPDDLGSFLGISLLGTLFNPPLNGNPFHAPAPIARVLDALPTEAALAAKRASVVPVWDNDALFASADTRPAGATGDAAQARSRDVGAGVGDDALAATLLLDLAEDLFATGRRGSLSADGASQLVGTNGGTSGGLGQDDGDPRTPIRGGPGGGDVGIPDDPFAWVQYADVGAGAGGTTTSAQATRTANTANGGNSVTATDPGATGTEGDLSGLGYGDDGRHPGEEGRDNVPATLDKDFGRVPVAFEANVGQTDESVRFLARGVGHSLFLTDGEAVLDLAGPRTTDDEGRERQTNDVLRLRFAGANPTPDVVGHGELDTKSNYFKGSDPTGWHTDVSNYGAVRYRSLYDGVDLVWRPSEMSGRQLQFDYRIKAGASADVIALDLGGARSVRLAENGDLVVGLTQGDVTLLKPVLYQEGSDGQREYVQGGYRLLGGGRVGFDVGESDPTRELVIDPTISWASYIGGTGNDAAEDVAVGADGAVYLVGTTASANFPTSPGAYQTDQGSDDVFVTKLARDGQSLLWSTYVGGSSGDAGYGIAVDTAGAAYVTGVTSSTDFPLQGAFDATPGSAIRPDAFLVKVAPAGNAAVYASYYGETDRDEYGYDVAVDGAGSAYVVGTTAAPEVEAFAPVGVPDVFLFKAAPSGGALAYDTTYGGTGEDQGFGVAVTAGGEAVITGLTTSTDLPVTGAIQGTIGGGMDAFVAKFSAGGSGPAWATYLGGASGDRGLGVALDRDANVYVVGDTASSAFPTRNAHQASYGGSTDAFLTKVKADGTTYVYSTFLGGSGTDYAFGVAVDGADQAWVAGYTTGSFTTVDPLQSHGGGDDAFAARYNPAGTLTFATYLGGSSADRANGVALDRFGDPAIAGYTSGNFPTVDPLYGTSAGGNDAFVAKLNAAPWAKVTTITNDTGAFATDQVTNDTTLHLLGVATPSATVTLYREDLGRTVIGTTTATAGGTWAYDYTGTSLPQRVYNFKATATSAGQTSLPSSPFLVTVDTAAPAVTLTMPATTTDFSPAVRIVATDNFALAPTSTVTLHIDSDNNGTWDGTQTATLTNGLALFEVANLGSTGTRKFKAEVVDLAGNPGYSATVTVDVVATGPSWVPTPTGGTVDALQGDATLAEGSLLLFHGLDLDLSPGTVGFGLGYASQTATSKPVVAVDVVADNSQALPPSVTLTLTWDTGGTPTTYASTFATTGRAPGEVFTLGVQGPTVTMTARYAWRVDGSANYGGGAVTFAYAGSSFVVSRDNSAYGAGWSLGLVNALVDIPASGLLPAGKLLVMGSGPWAFFEGTTTFDSPDGDAGTLAVSGGGWVYTETDGRKAVFDSSGKQTNALSADGLSVYTFTYSGANLVGIQSPDTSRTTLAYSGGKVQTLTTGARAVTLTYSGDDLVKVTNPDGGVHTLGYDANHKVTSEAFGVTRGSYSYHATYQYLTGWTVGDGTDAVSTTFTPAVALGLGSIHSGPRAATVTDPSGAVRDTALDAAGRVMGSFGPTGATGGVVRDGEGWVTSSTDALGRTTSFGLDAMGSATIVNDPDGSSRKFAYANDAFHSLTMMTDGNNKTTQYGYDLLGHRTTVTDALGKTTSFTYSSTTGLLETVKDARNNVTTYSYDSFRRLETVRYGDGGVATITYDSNGNVASTVDPLGNRTTFTNDALGRVLVAQTPDGARTTSTFDATGLVLTVKTSANVTVQYEYNTRGEQRKVTEGAGLALARTTLSQSDPVARTAQTRDAMGNWTTQTADAAGNVISTQDALGQTTAVVPDLAGQTPWSRNELGQAGTQAYDAMGRVIGTTDPLGFRTTSGYDAAGNRTAFQDGNGNRVTTTYDDLNRVSTVQTAAGTTTTVYDDAGNVWKTIDQAGKTVTSTYDSMNRLWTVTNPEGETVTYGYDQAGNQVSVTNARGKTVTTVYDAMNRAIATVNADGERTTTVYAASGVVEKTVNALNQTTTYLYDSLNRNVGWIDPLGNRTTLVLDALGRTVATIDATGKVSQTLYDQLGRVIGTVDGLGNATRTDYAAAGRVIQSIDANGNATQYVYDENGRLWVTIDPNGGAVTQGYDANGNLRTYTDPLGNTTTFSYDSLNREIQRTDALGNSLTYAYDTRSRMASQTDRLGRRKDWTYDDAGRVLTETWVNSGGGTANVLTYTYDDNGNALTADDYDGTYTLTYDNQDRLRTQAGLFGVGMTFSYDALSRRTMVEDSFGGVLSSTYDAAGRLTKRQFGGTAQATLTYERGYTAAGETLWVKRYSDLSSTNLVGTSTYTYDAGDRLTFIQHKDGSGTNVAAYTYTFDYGGRVTEEKRNGTSVTYSYDTRSQLTQAGADAYSYDSNGNRTMSGYTTGAGNRLTNDGTFTYTYDLEGNVETKGKGAGLERWYYAYDHNNRLLSVRKTSDGTTDTLTVTYAYDVFGNRVKEDKWSSGPGLVTTKFVYLGQEVYLDLTNANAVQMRYVQGDVADEMLVRIDGSNNVAWFLTDRLGSIRDIVNGSGSVIDSITFDAYGKITAETNPGNRGWVAAFGYVFDSNTGLANSPAGRQYWVDMGRWGGTDSIWFQAGDPNLYRYVANNPTNATDPSGNEILTFGGVAAAAGGTAALSNPVGWAIVGAAAITAWYIYPEVQKRVDTILNGLWRGPEIDYLPIAPPLRPVLSRPAGRDPNDGAALPGRWVPGEDWAWAPPAIGHGGTSAAAFRRRWEDALTMPLSRTEAIPATVTLAEILRRKEGKGACFAAGTPMRTPEGSKRIELIRPGDYVLSRSEYDLLGQVEARQVEEVFQYTERIWVLLVGGKEIRTTGEHPFFVKGQGWLPVAGLKVGDELASEDGRWLTVEGVEDTGRDEAVFNFRVGDFHTYFVGCDEWGFSVWAHNICMYHYGIPGKTMLNVGDWATTTGGLDWAQAIAITFLKNPSGLVEYEFQAPPATADFQGLLGNWLPEYTLTSTVTIFTNVRPIPKP